MASAAAVRPGSSPAAFVKTEPKTAVSAVGRTRRGETLWLRGGERRSFFTSTLAKQRRFTFTGCVFWKPVLFGRKTTKGGQIEKEFFLERGEKGRTRCVWAVVVLGSLLYSQRRRARLGCWVHPFESIVASRAKS